MEAWFIEILSVVIGLVIGSFLTVCIYRIPIARGLDQDEEEELNPSEHKGEMDFPVPPIALDGLSLNNPKRSICPHCRKQLKAWHNIPFFSWFFLKGRCAFCHESISFRYPLVEALTALSSWLSYTTFGLSITAIVVFAFCAALIVISFIDYDYYIIPNVISLPGVVIGLALALLNQFLHIFTTPIVPGLIQGLIGLAVGGGFLLLVSEMYYFFRKKEGLGMGDVKLLAMTGAFFGWQGSVYTIFVGSLLGSVGGILLAVILGRKMSKPLPFGPYLALGTILYIFFGASLGNGTFGTIEFIG